MRILYLHQYFATPNSNGGTRSYEMAKRLVSKGHKVTFITSSAFLSIEEQGNLSKGWNEIEIEGFNLHVLHLPYSNKDSYLSRIIKFFRFSIQSTFKSFSIESDVVLATSTPLTIAIPGLLYSKIKKVPMVFEVRDLWPELPIAIGAIKNPLVIRVARMLELLAYNNSKRLIGLSPGMCEGIERLGIESSKIKLATNSCDTDLFDIDPSVGHDYKKTLSFIGDRKLIVYTGTFGVINNVSYIVDLASQALKDRDDICFLAVGDGKEKHDVLEYARKKGVLNKNLYILDPVPKLEVVKILSVADLALSLFGPIKEMWHNSANKLFDALASQTPIAINYGGWQKDFIEKSGCGLVLDPHNHAQSIEDIGNLFDDSAKYLEAKEACHNLSYNYYSRDLMASRLESALLEAYDDKTII